MPETLPARQPAAAQADAIAYALHGNLYLNITSRCTLRCAFCPKFNGTWEVQGYDLRLRRQPSTGELIAAIGDPARYREVVFCGLGEPTLRLEVLLAVAREVKRRGGRTRVNTDGLANLVHGRDVTPEFEGVIDTLSVSLNAQNEDVYDRHCRPKRPGSYPAMLDFVRRATRHVPRVMVSALDGLEGVDIAACERIAAELGAQWRGRVLDEVG